LRKALVPECAMVPRFWTSSSRVMPMPVSAMVRVDSFSSVISAMEGPVSPPGA